MELNLDDGSSSTSSSSSSYIGITETQTSPSVSLPKRKAGRKKFKETRHQVYKGVRLRNGCKWVCEVREPKKKSRIWLGTFPTPEMAARAHDVATLALRGDKSPLNFPDSAHLLRRAKSCSARDIQKAALEAAAEFMPKPNDNEASTLLSFRSDDVKSENVVVEAAEAAKEVETMFVDEEPLFNMPSFYNSMAEGLVITPLGMKRGFNWSDDFDYDMDMTLWKD